MGVEREGRGGDVPASRHLGVLFVETFFGDVGDVVVESAWGEGVTHREEGVHPICGFVDLQESVRLNALKWGEGGNLVVLVGTGVVLLHAHDKVEDGDKGADGIWVAPEHDVAESDVVVGGNVSCCYTGEGRLFCVSVVFAWRGRRGYLLVELDVVHDFEGEGKVAEEDVYA